MKERLITTRELKALAEEGTSAHRLWTGGDNWIDRFGDDYVISTKGDGRDLVEPLARWTNALGLETGRVFVRRLVKQAKEDHSPEQVAGEELPLKTVVSERGLKFGIDFSAGYSAGLFCDQRANRAHLESLRPKRVLNCFSYTCAFSVAAARAGAETLSLDLSRKSLDRGRENFLLNDMPLDGHRFIADDVFAVLPKLERKGEKFDAIVLDPPTFSRGVKGRIFRAEQDFGELLELAKGVAQRGAHILLSTNSRELNVYALKSFAHRLRTNAVAPPPEYPPDSAATTLWVAAP
ncbi:MAG: class I SAM-dependent methyltransferase [Chthoniobacterales bacterium]